MLTRWFTDTTDKMLVVECTAILVSDAKCWDIDVQSCVKTKVIVLSLPESLTGLCISKHHVTFPSPWHSCTLTCSLPVSRNLHSRHFLVPWRPAENPHTCSAFILFYVLSSLAGGINKEKEREGGREKKNTCPILCSKNYSYYRYIFSSALDIVSHLS